MKTVVVTGATSGIGYAVALEVARRNLQVIGIGRNRERCLRAREAILETSGNGRVRYEYADLSVMEEIRDLGRRLRGSVREIDVLVNNAGTFTMKRSITADGHELQFAVNYLAAFLLTHELLPLLRMSSDPRVITLSSGSHYPGKIRWNDPMLTKRYNGLAAYEQSKLADAMFAAELHSRFRIESPGRGAGSPVSSFSVDPGLVGTEMGFKGAGTLAGIVWKIRLLRAISPEQGADTIVYLAADPEVTRYSGTYWKERRRREPSSVVTDREARNRLWEMSMELCGIGTYGEP